MAKVCCPINPIPNFNTLVPLSTRLSPPIETQSVPSNVQLPKKPVDLPQPPVCGSSSSLQYRIYVLGGNETAINEYPWMALIEYTTRVRLGEWNTKSDPDCEDDQCADPVQDISVVEWIQHADYNPYSKSHENDIALLRLAHPLNYTDWIKPICVPTSSKNYDGVELVVAGWSIAEAETRSNVTMKVGHMNKRIFFYQQHIYVLAARKERPCRGIY
ncbi:serine protease easter-like [Contarinia nasturtii]|uniref:serine protease easter-like n=1 Tax=Contarinia nasturtii TaxID=265458 RepID=UPI0012D4C01C|nr:serine protease easter-like [Contarinia nasturtii]